MASDVGQIRAFEKRCLLELEGFLTSVGTNFFTSFPSPKKGEALSSFKLLPMDGSQDKVEIETFVDR